MRSIRLMPVVVFATLALLVLKSIGLLTGGGYLLDGTIAVQAASGATEQSAAEGAAHGEDAPVEQEGEAAEEGDGGGHAAAAGAEGAAGHGESEIAGSYERPVETPASEIRDGQLVPLGTGDGQQSAEQALLERLGTRRSELDGIEAELQMRQGLLDAAEQRLQERMAALEAIEASITQSMDQKKAMEAERFQSVIAMYETMKPAEAAVIFDALDLDVLLRVARGMNPRKMAPILAKMSPERAQELTVQLAGIEPEPSLPQPVEDLSELPQIIGQ